MKTHYFLIPLLSIGFFCGWGSESNLSLVAATAHASSPQKVEEKSNGDMISLEVTATAYTSNADETDNTPSVTAWGDKLKPGMKVIAVSRDLIKMGLTHQTKVTIDGLGGEYLVLDKMHRKWTKKIDIYMGLDRKKAKKWGKRKVVIHWLNEL